LRSTTTLTCQLIELAAFPKPKTAQLPIARGKMSTKVTNKSVYDLQRKELKNRTELKFEDGLKVQMPAASWAVESVVEQQVTLTLLP